MRPSGQRDEPSGDVDLFDLDHHGDSEKREGIGDAVRSDSYAKMGGLSAPWSREQFHSLAIASGRQPPRHPFPIATEETEEGGC